MDINNLSDTERAKIQERYERDGRLPITISLDGHGSERLKLAYYIKKITGMELDAARNLLDHCPTSFDYVCNAEELAHAIGELDALGAVGSCEALNATFGSGVYINGELLIPHQESSGTSAAPSTSGGSAASGGSGCLKGWLIFIGIICVLGIVLNILKEIL